MLWGAALFCDIYASVPRVMFSAKIYNVTVKVPIYQFSKGIGLGVHTLFKRPKARTRERAEGMYPSPRIKFDILNP